jgi:hypothetical protein
MPPGKYPRNPSDWSDLQPTRRQAHIIQRHFTTPCPCLLCGTFPARYRGIFRPDTPALWGGKAGKIRLLGYALCVACYALPDRNLHVEARLQARLGARRN